MRKILNVFGSVTSIDMDCCARLVTAATLKAMQVLGSALTRLDLNDCTKLCDADLALLEPLKSLTVLNLRGCKLLTGAGLEGLTNLTDLNLGHTDACDAGVARLGGLTKLTSLDLDGPGGLLTDVGLAALRTLSALTTLSLRAWDVSADEALIAPLLPTSLTRLNLTHSTFVDDMSLRALHHLTALSCLSLQLCEGVQDEGIAALLQRTTGLTRLNLGGCAALTPTGLAAVAGLSRLTDLDLGFTGLTDEGVAALAPLTALTRLNLQDNDDHLTGAGLDALPSLTWLSLIECRRVNDAGIAALGALTRLSHLDLDGCDRVSKAGVRALGALTGLAHLELPDGVKVTETGITALASLTGLEYLRMTVCRCVTVPEISALAALTRLKRIELRRPDLTEEAMAALRQQMPAQVTLVINHQLWLW